ncbi:2-oxoglutarate and iron-dependent oxygenase domain-containing protein 1 [Dirofilaria immitis]|nr:2-oxoglutarate and iron-dependent oxygenase domain-containing protein 1 [Dirofilaria immitis]
MINSVYLTDEYATEFRKILSGDSEFSKPFPHFCLPDFLTSKEFVADLRSELQTVQYDRRENDLYSLDQTTDLANFDVKKFPKLTKFRDLFKTDVLYWLRDVSGVDLNSEVAITSSNYNYTDLLLPHDDQCEGRKFAFTLYLTPDWEETDGGQLLLYNCDDNNNPISVGKIMNPMENMLMMFEVSPRSWHMVTEVLSKKGRLSLHGWFHHTVCNVSDKVKLVAPEGRLKPHMNIAYEEVLEWINPEYIDPSQQSKIQSIFEENSEISLFNFIPEDKFESTLYELERRTSKMSRLREYTLPLDSNLLSLLRLVRSQAMSLLLSQWTGLPIHSIDDCCSEPDTKKKKIDGSERENVASYEGIECYSSIYRVAKSSYTMVDDEIVSETEQLGYCLDFNLFLCTNEWDDEHGGFISYFTRNEEKEVLRVSPVRNSAALVFREPGVCPFVKYVNNKAGDRHYYVINCSFYGFTVDDCSDRDSEESLRSETEEDDEAGPSRSKFEFAGKS